MATVRTNPDAHRPGLDAETVAHRQSAMAVLAEAEPGEIARLIATVGELPQHEDVRRAESGLVMVRGRISGDGAPFNVGEATVSRAAVRLASGEVGFGYVLGRDQEKARLIALCDALLQHDSYRGLIEQNVVGEVRARRVAERAIAAERTAATRVDFFTLVRGED